MTDPKSRRRRSGREWTVLFIVLLVGAVAGAAIWANYGPTIAAAEAGEPADRSPAPAEDNDREGNAAGAR